MFSYSGICFPSCLLCVAKCNGAMSVAAFKGSGSTYILVIPAFYPCSFVGSLGTIVIKCKDLRIIQLDIPGMEESLNIASSIEVKRCIQVERLQYTSGCFVEVHIGGWGGAHHTDVCPRRCNGCLII